LTTLRSHLFRHRLLRATRAWLSGAFAVTSETREGIVRRMLEGHARTAPTYWMQLCISLGIATLGLVLNSSAVIIGAMLVSPLMNPIIELGMGLAVGSPLLSIRSLVRTTWSIVVVVLGAALITKSLPFHAVTGEITARASPTALDLLVAIFCALAAAFITLRSASESAAAAAGTAVAIALVPPLCVVGFGLGTSDRMIAEGAFLLFTANFSGILLFSVLTFWLFGFNLVDTRHLEEKRFGDPGPTSRSVLLAKRLFGSRYGTSLRLIIPLALVVAVLLPLSHALREVTWEVRTRAQIQDIIGELPLAQAAVRSSVSVGHRSVAVRLVVVGKASEARTLQLQLATRISRLSGANPTVVVVAVPDLDTMESVARKFAKTDVPEVRPQADLLKTTGDVGDALKRAWPEATAGQLRRWRLDRADADHPRLEIVHLGAPLGATAETLLASLLSDRLHASIVIHDVAIPLAAVTAKPEDGAGWLPALASAVEWVRRDPGLYACLVLPPPEVNTDKRKHRRKPASHKPVVDLGPMRDAALAELATAPQDRVHSVPGPAWSVQLKTKACDGETPSP
jgi:uncharacterized hydrophobic protein (TIGR00271 family)